MMKRAIFIFFFSSRRRHTRSYGDWSSDVCSSDLGRQSGAAGDGAQQRPGDRPVRVGVSAERDDSSKGGLERFAGRGRLEPRRGGEQAEAPIRAVDSPFAADGVDEELEFL